LTKQTDEALAWYREIPRGEHYASAQLRVAVLLDGMGKRAEAAELLKSLRDEGLDDDDKLAESYLLEGELAIKHKDKPAALAVYDKGLEALPDQRKLLYARALLNEQLDKLAEAERDLRRVVELDPEDADALNALGYTLADRTERLDEALALIEKALEHKPNEPAIVDSLGWVQFRMGKRDEAVKQLERAFELKPDPEIAAHLGEALWSTGRKDDARKIWEQGKKLDPGNELLAKTIKRLTR
jgi:Flp pilus assembly protein TadD